MLSRASGFASSLYHFFVPNPHEVPTNVEEPGTPGRYEIEQSSTRLDSTAPSTAQSIYPDDDVDDSIYSTTHNRRTATTTAHSSRLSSNPAQAWQPTSSSQRVGLRTAGIGVGMGAGPISQPSILRKAAPKRKQTHVQYPDVLPDSTGTEGTSPPKRLCTASRNGGATASSADSSKASTSRKKKEHRPARSTLQPQRHAQVQQHRAPTPPEQQNDSDESSTEIDSIDTSIIRQVKAKIIQKANRRSGLAKQLAARPRRTSQQPESTSPQDWRRRLLNTSQQQHKKKKITTEPKAVEQHQTQSVIKDSKPPAAAKVTTFSTPQNTSTSTTRLDHSKDGSSTNLFNDAITSAEESVQRFKVKGRVVNTTTSNLAHESVGLTPSQYQQALRKYKSLTETFRGLDSALSSSTLLTKPSSGKKESESESRLTTSFLEKFRTEFAALGTILDAQSTLTQRETGLEPITPPATADEKEPDLKAKDSLLSIPASPPKDPRLIKPLTPTQEHALLAALSSPMNKAVGVGGLTRKDLGTLLPQRGTTDRSIGWLNDEVVNLFLTSLCTALNATEGYEDTRDNKLPPKYRAFNSQWYPTIRDKGPSIITRWSKRAKLEGPALLQASMVFVPINDGVHWTLLIICPPRKELTYYDSMGSRGAHIHKLARAWLECQLGSSYTPSEWKEIDGQSERQGNSNDCGVFVLLNAWSHARGLVPGEGFEQADLPAARRYVGAVMVGGGFGGEGIPVA